MRATIPPRLGASASAQPVPAKAISRNARALRDFRAPLLPPGRLLDHMMSVYGSSWPHRRTSRNRECMVLRSLCAAALRSWCRLSYPEIAQAMHRAGMLSVPTAHTTCIDCDRRWRRWRADQETAARAWEIESELMAACGVSEPICTLPPENLTRPQDAVD